MIEYEYVSLNFVCYEIYCCSSGCLRTKTKNHFNKFPIDRKYSTAQFSILQIIVRIFHTKQVEYRSNDTQLHEKTQKKASEKKQQKFFCSTVGHSRKK